MFGKISPLLLRASHDSFGLATLVFGTHVSVSLCFMLNEEGNLFSLFDININSQVFEEIFLNAKLAKDSKILQGFMKDYDTLKLNLSADERERLLKTCKACVVAKKRYNYRDVLLYNVPFRDPVELSLFQTETLHDTQAVILILRECLNAGNPLVKVLSSIHSRTTMPSLLYETLFPCSQPVNLTLSNSAVTVIPKVNPGLH